MYDLPCGDLFRIWEKVLGFALGSFVTFMHEDTDMPVGSSWKVIGVPLGTVRVHLPSGRFYVSPSAIQSER